VTGDIGESSNGIEFRHSNGSQGIGFGYNSIYATGSTSNQNLNIIPRGTGRVGILNSGQTTNYINIGSYMNNGSTRSISGLQFLANPQFGNGDNGQRSAGFIRSGFYQGDWATYISLVTRSSSGSGTEQNVLTCKEDRVGIGITNPSLKLHVYTGNGTDGSNAIRMQATSSYYDWAPGEDGWLRLKGSSASNMWQTYTSLAVGNFWAAGSTRFSSDDRVKHFEEPIVNSLELIQQLQPYKYKKTTAVYDEDYTGDIGDEWEWEIGLIAQQIKEIPYLSFMVTDPETNPDNIYGLKYNNFIGLCIQGIKDLDAQLQAEKQKMASLLARIEALENSS